MCQKLSFCFFWTFSFGLRNGGGIGDSIRQVSYTIENRARFFTRIFYDIIFHSLICVILINIVLGIIINTFGQLRQEKNDIDEDIKNNCYVCGLNRVQFDKNADGF